MKLKPGLRLAAIAAAAVAVTGSLAFAAPAGALARPLHTARVSTSARPLAPAPHKVNLHPAYELALPHAHHGTIVMTLSRSALRRLDSRPKTLDSLQKTKASASSCKEPACNLAYGGGPVQHNPKVYLLLWGPNWPDTSPAYNYLYNFYSGLGTSSDHWSTTTTQYTDSNGRPTFTGSVFAGAWQDSTTPKGTGPDGSISDNDINAEADGFVQDEKLKNLEDVQIVIAAQPGTCFADGWAGQPKACKYQPSQQYCGWHTNSNLGETYTNLPSMADAGTNCGEYFVNTGSAGTWDGYSVNGGHEFAESVTDPYPNSGWIDLNDSISGGEIADKCAWGGENWNGSEPFGNVKFSTGTFAMQSLWSNAARTCLMATPTITLTNPGAQKTTYGASASLHIHAADSAKNAVTFSATGLPKGLTISTSTGAISGKPSVSASYTVTVSAKDIAFGHASITFKWAVTEPNVYIKAGKLAGNLVVNDTSGSHVSGTQVQVWTEAGLSGSSGVLARQNWLVAPMADASGDTISLRGTNLCLAASGNGIVNGTKVVLLTCNGQAYETWLPLKTGQLEAVNATAKSHKVMVLDDPGTGGIGTKLQIWQSSTTRHQLWTLP